MSTLHPKNAAQKHRLLHADHWLCMERARLFTESHRETEGLAPSLRAAHALAHVLAEMTVRIEPDELLVGNRSAHLIAPPIALERGDFSFVFEHLWEDLQAFGYRISAEDERVLFEELLPYWRGKTVRDDKLRALAAHALSSTLDASMAGQRRRMRAFGVRKLAQLVAPRTVTAEPRLFRGAARAARLAARLPRLLRAVRAGSGDNLKGRGRCTDAQAHIVLGHGRVLAIGFSGIRAHAHARLAALDASGDARPEERAFLEAVLVSCDAMRAFSLRFRDAALAQAERETDANRKDELRAIAAACERAPWLPPRSFHEAVQALWFTQNAAIISYGAGSGITPGRVDQLLAPFYEADIARGALTRAHALRLVEELLIKLNNNVVIWPNLGGVELNHLGSDVENITLGGVDRDGRDATNDLTALFLEAIENTSLATTASLRVSRDTPPALLARAVDVHKRTCSLAFLNDDTAIAALVHDGYSEEDARDYCLVGCVEPSGSGDSYGATGGSKVYFPTALDLVFQRGRTTFFGNVDGPDTGAPEDLASFDALLAAFFTQLEAMVETVTHATRLRDAVWAARFHNPLISSTIDGCIENARDMTQGGARYNFGSVGGGGLATAVDSLAAIREVVFEQRVATMQQLRDAIAVDFRGHDALRERLRAAPRFGNDIERVDAIAHDVVERFCAMVSARKTACGGRYKASLISYGLNTYEGALEPASADGRGAGEPLSNSMSPQNGAEQRGPTAALRSLARIDQTRIGFGNSVNMRLPLGLLEDAKGRECVIGLVRGYFAMGGFHLQLNTIDTATLRAAQEHPEQYTDLIVRVSGYSAYFTRLGRRIQDDIIGRAELAA